MKDLKPVFVTGFIISSDTIKYFFVYQTVEKVVWCFIYTLTKDMRKDLFLQYFSKPRIERYLIASDNKITQAKRLYRANLQLAQAFHPLLGVLEVVLRNQINEILTQYFSDLDWIINQKSGFMIDPSLSYQDSKTGKIFKNNFLLLEVKKAERKIRKSKQTITGGKVVAEQNLGFWTELFERRHYKLLEGRPIKVFAFLPRGCGRRKVNADLNRIRRLRNRISHNEPICFSGRSLDLSMAKMVHENIIDILLGINPEIIKWLKPIDRVAARIEKLESA